MSNGTPSLQHLQARQEEVAALCRRHRVRRLAVFGSTVRGEAKAGSDYDFLVDFDALPPGAYATAFFVERAIRNPYFRQSVQVQSRELYAN
jgi:predicted nucleotidyltransferase